MSVVISSSPKAGEHVCNCGDQAILPKETAHIASSAALLLSITGRFRLVESFLSNEREVGAC
jgi:hypothetical protein